MTTPQVSVCINSYNRELYIRECLDSVFAQTYRDFEVVVVDDASTDGTVDILRSYGERIRLLERASNTGMCQITRNQAIRAAKGRFIALLDSDDSWYPSKLENQLAFFERHADVPICHSYVHLIDNRSQVLAIRHEGRLQPTGMCFREMLNHCWITISSVMVRRELFDRIGYFNEDPFWRMGEDYEFFLRVSRASPIGLIPDVLARYRKSAAGITSDQWRYQPRGVPAHERVLETPDLWKGVVPRSEVVEMLTTACLENCAHWRDGGSAVRALYFALRALRHDPANGRAWMELLRSAGRGLIPRN